MKKITVISITIITFMALIVAIGLQNYFVVQRFNENIRHTEKTIHFLLSAYGQGIEQIQEQEQESLIKAFLNTLKTEIENIGFHHVILSLQKTNTINNVKSPDTNAANDKFFTKNLIIGQQNYQLHCLLPEAELFQQSWQSVILFTGLSLLIFTSLISIFSFLGISIILNPLLPQQKNSINMMFSPYKIVRSIAAIKNYQQTLEAEVKARTIELENKNHILSQAKQESESASLAKSRFLASMSHEIRTPMNAILCMTDLALDNQPEPTTKDYLENILQAARHLLTVLNDILDISKIEANKLVLNPENFSLAELMYSTIQTMRFSAQQKGLQLVYQIVADTPDFINTDPTRLRQVLVNLLSNAIKFTEKGSVSVKVFADKQQKDNSCYLYFTVTDSGKGFSPKQAEKLFESFEQGEVFISRKYGGTGLGLSICKELVRLMEGEISAQSILHQGSVFSFYIKVQTAKGIHKEQSHHKNKSISSKKLNILLVEDEPLNIKVAELYLKKMGHTCQVAQNAKLAFQLLQIHFYDIVLMDVEMPEISGIEAIRRLRNGQVSGVNHRIPIISLTAHATTEIKESCLTAGANAYLSKPISYEALYQKLEELAPSETLLPNKQSKETGDSNHHLSPDKPNNSQAKSGLNCLCPEVEVLERVAIDSQTYRNLLQVFYADGVKKLQVLRNACQEQNIQLIKNTAHSFKSSSWLIGADRLRELAIELEELCEQNKSPQHLETLLPSFIAEVQAVIDYIAA